MELEILTYHYGEIVKKITRGSSNHELVEGALQSIMQMNRKEFVKDKFLHSLAYITNIDEIMTSLLITRFYTLYSISFDKVFKNGNNYELNREEYLSFKDLDLSDFKPSIININRKGILDITKNYKSELKKIENLLNKEEIFENRLKEMKSVNLEEKKKEIVLTTEEYLENIKTYLKSENENLLKLSKDYIDITNDYKENYKYFYNLAIIEGIRNSISHGNYEIINAGEHSNFNDVKIRFRDEYKGEVVFLLEISLWDFQALFEDYNIGVITKFEEKILKKG